MGEELIVRDGNCGHGMYDCGGVCQSYPCWSKTARMTSSFFQLQMTLDALDVAVKRWCNVPDDETKSEERVNEIIRMLQPVIDKTEPYKTLPVTSDGGSGSVESS